MKILKQLERYLLVITLTLLVGCSQRSPDDYLPPIEVEAQPIVENGSENAEISADSNDNSDSSISGQNLTINYTGDFQVMRSFAIGNQSIYINGKYDSDFGFEVIKTGDSRGVKVDCTIPDDMIVLCMSSDDEGNGYALLMSFKENEITYKRSEIWKINTEGKLVEKIDVSKAICGENAIRPNIFSVSQEGNFYIVNELGLGHIVVLNPKGELIYEIHDKYDRGYHGIGRGNDGNIYITCEDTSIIILKVTNENSLEELPISLPIANAKYSTIGASPTYDLTVLNLSQGASVIDITHGTTTLNYEASAFPCEKESIIGKGFMDDGRLVLIENSSANQFIFHYISI